MVNCELRMVNFCATTQRVITRLFPRQKQAQSLEKTYLNHKLHQLGTPQTPFTYSAFITSLDSRVAVERTNGNGTVVPRRLANKRDWRLFQELAAQADVIVISGSFLREWARNKVKDLAQSDMEPYLDLGAWRAENGLSPKADLAIVSASLNLEMPEKLTTDSRKKLFFTTKTISHEILNHALQFGTVYQSDILSGKVIIDSLKRQGYQTVFVATGPRNLSLMLDYGLLDRLYLTQSLQLLGGKKYMSIVEGQTVDVKIGLSEMYLDREGNQLFCVYDRQR